MMPTHDAAKAAEPEVADARRAADLINQMEIRTNEDLQTATSWIAEVKLKASEVDGKRRSFVDPLNGVIRQINDFFRPALEALASAEAALKAKVQEHVGESMAQRDRLLSQVAKTTDAAERKALVTQAQGFVPEKVDGLSVRETWMGEVVDMEALVRWAVEEGRWDLLEANAQKLIAITKATGYDPGIPGWKAVVKRVVAVTASKVRA